MVDAERQLVARLYTAINTGDARLFELLHPDIAWITPPSLPWTLPDSDGAYVGHHALRAYFRACVAAVDGLAVQVDELISMGQRVLMLGREHGTSRATGRAFNARCAHVWTVALGLAVRLEGYPDTAAMRAAFDR